MDEKIKESEKLEEKATEIANNMLKAFEPFLSEIKRLKANIKELEERQKWIDEVGRPFHPDDERPWCSAYLDCRIRIKELEAELSKIKADPSIGKLTVDEWPETPND